MTDAGPSGSNANYIGIDTETFTSGSVVPEPSALLLTGLGLAGFALLRRRRKGRVAAGS